MLPTRGYATTGPTAALAPFNFERRDPRPNDVLIKILYCGICHSDIHQARNEWKSSTYPMVPGHEIVGKVERIGAKVKKFKIGDSVGVGCFVDSCRNCHSCKADEQHLCERHLSSSKETRCATFGGETFCDYQRAEKP